MKSKIPNTRKVFYGAIVLLIIALIITVILKNQYNEKIPQSMPNERYLELMANAMNAKNPEICLEMENQTQKDMCLDAIDCINFGSVKEKTKCGDRTEFYLVPLENDAEAAQSAMEDKDYFNATICASINDSEMKKGCEDYMTSNRNSS